jgi:hypothetical protein
MRISNLVGSTGIVRVGKAARTCRVLRMPLIACVWIVTACASHPPPPARSGDPASPAPAQAPKAEARGCDADTGTTPSASPMPPKLQRLVRSVRALEDSAEDPAHHRLTRSLRDAADALDELEPDRTRGDSALRTAAARIEASGVNSPNHGDELRTALVAAGDRLRAHDTGAQRAKVLDAALDELERRVGTLSASRPLLEQRRAVSGSFQALADAVFLAAGHDAPFADRALEPRSAADVMEQARADVLTLGQADLSNVRALTSRAMYSMAELVEAVAGRGLVARQITEIRAEARRLEHDSSGPFARTGWVERGLQTALGALDELEMCSASLVAGWTDAARRAAATLPERGALPFQHAAMQDAFRATVDAFGVALLDRASCLPSSRRSRRVSVAADERASARSRTVHGHRMASLAARAM